jgi:hypothetical protein
VKKVVYNFQIKDSKYHLSKEEKTHYIIDLVFLKDIPDNNLEDYKKPILLEKASQIAKSSMDVLFYSMI